MEKNKIKETCSCGAMMEFEEAIDKFSSISWRQKEFHNAHEKCREVKT